MNTVIWESTVELRFQAEQPKLKEVDHRCQKLWFCDELRGSGKTKFRWVRRLQFRFWTVLTTYFSFWCCFLDGAIGIPIFQALIDAPFGRISSICKEYQQNHTQQNRKIIMINFKISNIGNLVFQTKTTFQKCFLHFWVLGSSLLGVGKPS